MKAMTILLLACLFGGCAYTGESTDIDLFSSQNYGGILKARFEDLEGRQFDIVSGKDFKDVEAEVKLGEMEVYFKASSSVGSTGQQISGETLKGMTSAIAEGVTQGLAGSMTGGAMDLLGP